MRRKPSKRKRKVKTLREWRSDYKYLEWEYEQLENSMEAQGTALDEEREKQTEHVRMIAEVTRDVIGYLLKVERSNLEVVEALSSARHVLNLTGRFVAKWGADTAAARKGHF